MEVPSEKTAAVALMLADVAGWIEAAGMYYTRWGAWAPLTLGSCKATVPMASLVAEVPVPTQTVKTGSRGFAGC